ncbi:CpaD family pilus assembly lipoprotein [Herbaspirillum sp. RV1423]|uniref:CpaD family pilus assembly lipoprotein n=1 Tax=Herbaspirillum sp. RV1423 TaxID=1443993 RepID=UPI0004BBBC40|nr:CpaD family pilus assembly lipoprotein [Herbaspirillum sp. RV1423]
MSDASLPCRNNRPSGTQLLIAHACLMLSLLLCACTSPISSGPEHSNLPHPVILAERKEAVSLEGGDPIGRNRALAAAVNRLGNTNLQVDLYAGPGVTRAQRTELVQQLRELGIADEAIRWRIGGEHQFEAEFRQTGAVAQGCPASSTWSDGRWFTGQTHTRTFGCSVNANLAAQIVNPRDLVQPERLAAPNPVTTIGAVEAYQRGEAAPLKDQVLVPGGGQKK